jgi:DNA helicase-2/ATP-dependent DNA helicase PcrA
MNIHTNLLDALNPEQRQAVILPPEHALILAGAGSGKTRVLTTRIAWLLQQGVSPGEILSVTFTNKAAKEMVTRLNVLLPINVHGMWIGTFHGLCHRFLRLHWDLVNLPRGFQILDMQDQLSAIKRLCKPLNLDDDRYAPKLLQKFINGHKEEGRRPDKVEVRNPETRQKAEIYQLYEDQCLREGVVDFGELLLRSYELLRDNTALREHYQNRFRHILIDEFQDTNRLQYAWIKLLAGDTGAVMAVGDDDQSIYAFRGANVGNMGDFVREFDIQHQIKLEQNYRSCGNILNSANALIRHNQHRLGKNLRTDQGAGEPVRIYEAPTDFDEARWMVEEIQALVKDKKDDGDHFPRKEIAVLYRSNAQSRVIETVLFNAKVPYRVYGGLRFFERAEIKHALAYLRLLDNPNDDTSFSRVVNFPARGIGARSLEQLQDLAKESGCSLHDAASLLKGRAGASIGNFVARIDVIREQTQHLNLRDMVAFMLQHSGLIAHYQADKEGADRLENLDELVNAAESFVSQEGFGQSLPSANETGETLSPLLAFLTHAALEAGDNMVNAGQDAVQLMTVHSSKGLEFDCVFISGLEEGLFPHENSQNDPKSLEEERRLMYVAITRARRRLYVSHSQSRMLHGQTRFNYKSRFLEELPAKALKWLTPKVQKMHWTNSPATAMAMATATVFAAATPSTTLSTASGTGLKVGMRVNHAKFGTGTVLTLEGKGNEARAQINFPMHGIKWMALSVAKLTPIA